LKKLKRTSHRASKKANEAVYMLLVFSKLLLLFQDDGCEWMGVNGWMVGLECGVKLTSSRISRMAGTASNTELDFLFVP
jgi:hypothetical protein